jgi:Ala-tRNA(Pro) deacylase
MFITVGDKSFKAKTFSSVLGVPRVSFAPSELMEKLLATSIGATTVFSTLYDKEQNIKIVIDKDVLNEEWYGCSDGTTTGYMKIKTKQIIHNFLPYTEHIPVIIEM